MKKHLQLRRLQPPQNPENPRTATTTKECYVAQKQQESLGYEQGEGTVHERKHGKARNRLWKLMGKEQRFFRQDLLNLINGSTSKNPKRKTFDSLEQLEIEGESPRLKPKSSPQRAPLSRDVPARSEESSRKSMQRPRRHRCHNHFFLLRKDGPSHHKEENRRICESTSLETMSTGFSEVGTCIQTNPEKGKRGCKPPENRRPPPPSEPRNVERVLKLGESTDLSDTAQLAIFIQGVDIEFTVTEELLALQSLKGTSKEKDIFNKVQEAFTSFGLPSSKLVEYAQMVYLLSSAYVNVSSEL
ncbi:General transcription factor II-I repeat domain-containing protein 2 [Eumeta japonica]|uniref:General transcription factor II-I repeat domain-containing protein 2 n=1 Tax=Eumeta variegata TaxID=151549 RepID=A0A4C1WUC7_EUMVA|nr:General transcription factor II-I repeat domain-containing protein 2 [Eumeta japonica]